MRNFFPKKTFLLIIGLALVTVLLLFLAIRAGQNQISTQTSTPASASLPQTNISISQAIASPVSTFKSEIEIETGQNKVTAVQLELSYDPKALTNVNIASGSFFPKPVVLLKKIDTTGGTISYALSSQDQKGISGKGTIAVLTFTPIAGQSGSTQIDFLPKTQVSAENLMQSALKSTTGIVFDLGPTPFPKQIPSSASAK
jgi:hypothetical protein